EHTSELQSRRDLVCRLLLDKRTDVCSRSEEHTSELQSRRYLVCRLLLEKTFRFALGQYAKVGNLGPGKERGGGIRARGHAVFFLNEGGPTKCALFPFLANFVC